MKVICNPPHAPSLMESMRSIGYSLEAALADLIDNSISAYAKTIRIEFRASDLPHVAILDDGQGMSMAELENAMRHGSASPLKERAVNDLGRYGLGLKTASLSQCRCMTVVSIKSGSLSGCCWDMDTVVGSGEWSMLVLEASDFLTVPYLDKLKAQEHGTMVLWQNLDRLSAGERSVQVALDDQMIHAREHLSLVFHRYINPESGKNGLSISINGNQLDSIDPFLLSHTATQRLDDDNFNVDGHKVLVKPYILPHISKMSPADLKYAGGIDGIRNQQGFYIYRNRRLIIGGTWFRLAGKDELGKLARVRVDIPNALDYLWTLDIKKSRAYPPEVVRSNLKRTIERIRGVSKNTLLFRGRSQPRADLVPVWEEIEDREGFRFSINRKHPLIQSLITRLNSSQNASLGVLLKVVELSIPLDAVYARMASDKKPSLDSEMSLEDLREMVQSVYCALPEDSLLKNNILSCLLSTNPFSQYPNEMREIIKELLDNE